uniref:Myosin light chain 7 n=1 Tax=Leptobrachium leishanense TaxID=445787 RepID=A0A8C5MFJ2_9ANUR
DKAADGATAGDSRRVSNKVSVVTETRGNSIATRLWSAPGGFPRTSTGSTRTGDSQHSGTPETCGGKTSSISPSGAPASSHRTPVTGTSQLRRTTAGRLPLGTSPVEASSSSAVSRPTPITAISRRHAPRASRKAVTRGKAAAKRAQRGSSNVFSMFEQSQIQEFKEAFSCIDQNRDGIITKPDLKETYMQLGKMNANDEELEQMLHEGKGPINFTVFLSLFGEKLNGTDPEDTIVNAFKILDPNGTGHVRKDEFKQQLMTQADRFTAEEVEQMFAVTPIDVAGNIDYKSLCYIITHGDEKEES